MLFTNPLTPPPPTVLLAEQACLAAAIATGQAAIKPDHCADPVHAAIIRAIRLRAAPGAPITLARLASDLGSALDEVGGPAYLNQLEALAPTPDAVSEAAGQVREAWQRRELISLGERLQELGTETVQNAFGGTSRASSGDQARQVHELVMQLMLDCAGIVASQPATVAQAAEIADAPGSLSMRVTPLEMENVASLNVQLSTEVLATGTDRATAERQAELHLARAGLFRRMAMAGSLL